MATHIANDLDDLLEVCFYYYYNSFLCIPFHLFFYYLLSLVCSNNIKKMTHKDKKKNPAMEVPQLMYECLRKYREIAANSILLMNENEGMNNEIIELPLAECAGYYSH